jgi:quercetin dioxygenase-like cupin family protein
MKNKTFDFHGTKMTIKVLTSETNDEYTIIDAVHPPNVGPALHMHPKGPEIFYIIDGDYEFVLDNNFIKAKTGDVISIPKGTPHRFIVGNTGGRVLITSPPRLEHYFFKVSELLAIGEVPWKTESDIANQYGQIFLDNAKHWSQ